jgi:hypothetical protein
MLRIIALAAFAFTAAAPAASATCSEEIKLLAEQYGLDATKEPAAGSAETPATMESRGTGPDDTRVPDAGAAGVAGATEAKRARMQSLLEAARVAEANGSEAQCLERLGEARAIPEPG